MTEEPLLGGAHGRRNAALAAAAGLVLLLLGLAWLLRGGSRGDRDREPQPERVAAADALLQPAVLEPGAAERRLAPAPDMPEDATAPIEKHEAAPPAEDVTATFVGSFVRPDRAGVLAGPGTLRLRRADGSEREVGFPLGDSVTVAGLPLGHYTALVRAPGFRHREQALDLSSLEYAEEDGRERRNGEPVFTLRLFLWPQNWVAVVVETRDGRPFGALAAELGMEPKQIFVAAFDARVWLEPPGPDAWSEPADRTVAVFRGPSGHHNWELPGAAVGSLELLKPPPLWAGLRVHQVPLGWELLPPGADEVVFRLDAAALEERLGRLRLRVVDANGTPLPGALVTLLADGSAYRRGDLHDAAADGDGRVELRRIVPDRYELTVRHGEALHQDMLQMAPAEERDLGDIVLGAAATVIVQVRKADGSPTCAWLELGPYRPGASERELYPPMLSRHADPGEDYPLALPSGRSIVRATVCTGFGQHYVSDDRSPSVLLDTEALPAGPIQLVVREPQPVRFSSASQEAASLAVLDELDLVLASLSLGGDEPASAELAPGSYRARASKADGAPLGVTSFLVLDAPLLVTLP
ncbi:MAG: carboxypeptidase regulatory-like domain-containing protein [Planctomycetota bacterium]|nr:MAG: carboxypeptidase regulatory-like domain-containing protein [Planctomycetota bacterium]